MKRILLVFLVLVLSLSLSACKSEEKSAAVRKIEGMISAMGEISLENEAIILMVQEQVSSLTEAERGQLANLEQFRTAWAEYLTLRLIEGGEWIPSWINYHDIDDLSDKLYVSFSADGSFTGNAFDEGNFREGTWHVNTDGHIVLTEPGGESIWVVIQVKDGEITLMEDWIPVAQYEAMVRERVLVVEVTQENWSDYMELGLYEETVRDAFGDPTGEVTAQLMLMSKLYDEGWLCYDSQDFAIELILPEHTYHRAYADGTEHTYTHEGGSQVVTTGSVPFTHEIMQMHSVSEEETFERDLTLDDIQVGRVMGKLYFIREEYVLSTRMESGWRYMTLDEGYEISVWHIEGLNY